ncbi:MAG TPA: protein kinase [Polyangia bacterium]|nr:protein kinase [Polyangia bacterium]
MAGSGRIKSDGPATEERLEAATTEALIGAAGVHPIIAATAARESVEQLRTGQILGGRYEIDEELGRGAIGKVYRAYDRVADETVAIKLLRHQRPQTTEAIDPLRSELRMARKVTHPGIVRIHDVIDLGDRLALSMEFVRGETLRARLQRTGRLNPAELRTLAVNLAQALDAAHRAGVLHCDLKPANIILREGSGQAVITDFGVSRFQPEGHDETPAPAPAELTLRETLSAHRTFGTPFYMAPELFEGQGPIRPALDVYALGLVLYEAATGTRPHQGRDLLELMRARLEAPVPPLALARPDLPPALCRAIDGCLRRDPAERPPCADVLRALAPARSILQMTWRRWLLLLLVLCLGGAVLLFGSGGMRPEAPRVFVTADLAPPPPGAEGTGVAGEEWIARAIAHLGAARLRQEARRFIVVEQEADADLILRLHARTTRGGIIITAATSPPRERERALGTAEASSVLGALGPLLIGVVEQMNHKPGSAGPDAAEAAGMKRLGTASLAAYRLYTGALDDYFRSLLVDVAMIEQHLEAAIKEDPGWAHPYAALVVVTGRVTPRAQEILARGRKLLDARRDPLGQDLLTSLDESTKGRMEAARQTVQQALRVSPDDILGLDLLAVYYASLGRADEQVGLFRRLHALRPDLQFGADLVAALERAGQADEVPAIARAWLERAPESEQALTTALSVDIAAGRQDQAERRARALLFLHGIAPHRLVTLCDVLIVGGRFPEARAMAERLLGAGQRERGLGLYRLGVIAILEGHLDAGYQDLVASAEAQRAFGIESELLQVLEALVSLEERFFIGGDRARHLEALEQTFGQFGMAAQEAATRYERALRSPLGKTCPARATFLKDLDSAPARVLAQREMVRAASDVGCARCAEVLQEGYGLNERSTRSMFRFAVCAEAQGASALAADAFRRASTLIASSLTATNGFAPDRAVLARYRLGRVLERLGRTAEARSEYERFLGFWGHADRPIPEVAMARQALARSR